MTLVIDVMRFGLHRGLRLMPVVGQSGVDGAQLRRTAPHAFWIYDRQLAAGSISASTVRRRTRSESVAETSVKAPEARARR